MMLDRPMVGYKSAHSLDVPFTMCEYHWDILNIAFGRYLITIDEAESQAQLIAMSCLSCETPGRY